MDIRNLVDFRWTSQTMWTWSGQLAFCGDDFRGSLGSDASVEVQNDVLWTHVDPVLFCVQVFNYTLQF